MSVWVSWRRPFANSYRSEHNRRPPIQADRSGAMPNSSEENIRATSIVHPCRTDAERVTEQSRDLRIVRVILAQNHGLPCARPADTVDGFQGDLPSRLGHDH